MQLTLLLLQIFLAIGLVLVVMLQRTSDEGWSGISTGGTSSNNFVSKRSARNFLTKVTIVLATLFMLNCLVLGNMAFKSNKPKSIFDEVASEQKHTDKKVRESKVQLAE